MQPHIPALEITSGATCLSIRSTDDLPTVVGPVADAMAQFGYPGTDIFAVRLALEEALLNAIKHGNKNDPSRQVRVRSVVTAERVEVEVKDEGQGFDPSAVPNPCTAEGQQRASGRGIHLMRGCLSSVRYNERGNAVTLTKLRGEPVLQARARRRSE
jgi:serine/threonine-protein kinase RsbW